VAHPSPVGKIPPPGLDVVFGVDTGFVLVVRVVLTGVLVGVLDGVLDDVLDDVEIGREEGVETVVTALETGLVNFSVLDPTVTVMTGGVVVRPAETSVLLHVVRSRKNEEVTCADNGPWTSFRKMP
jgi:hypothetical protein